MNQTTKSPTDLIIAPEITKIRAQKDVTAFAVTISDSNLIAL